MKKVLSFFKKVKLVLYKWIFLSFLSNFIQPRPFVNSTPRKMLCSCFLKVSIDHLFDNLEYGKRNYCFEKGLEIVLNFGSKKSVRTLYKWWLLHEKSYQIGFSSYTRTRADKGWAVKRALRSSFNVWCGVGLARALFPPFRCASRPAKFSFLQTGNPIFFL